MPLTACPGETQHVGPEEGGNIWQRLEVAAMEPVIIIVAICGLIAAGWAIGKTSLAVQKLREERHNQERRDGDSASIGVFVGGSTSGDSGYGHHGGDCGGHGHGGGDCGGGHGGW
jgi:hypothetical protein